jgi:uncharacterized protein (DUF433 family)
MVANVLSLLARGYDVARVLKNYPELTEDDVLAARTSATSASFRPALTSASFGCV